MAAERLPLRRALARSLGTVWLPITMAVAALASGAAHSIPAPQLVKYTTVSGGTGRARAQSMPQAAAPTAVVSSHQVTVSWPAATMSGGTPVPGYVVRRYNTSGVVQTILSNCSGVVTATSCVESWVPGGQWRYSVQAVVQNWVGAESAQGSVVNVVTQTLAFTSSTTISTLPTTLSGNISTFVASESLSFHLDSATGPTLSGTPATVPSGGSGSITVTIPVGTTHVAHTVFAVGSTGSFATASINVVLPPQLTSLVMKDTNANGKIDQVLATFDDTLASYTAGTAPWTLTNVPSTGTLASVAVAGNTATLTITEGGGAASTAAGTFKVALTANAAGIRDTSNRQSSFAATAVTDAAPPALLTLVMQDTGTANGKIDQVVATFSETLASYTAGTTPWTLAGVPSSGTLASVSVSTPTVTLTLTEGAGAADTSVGSFTLALAASATGVRDAAGNQSSFAARAPTDGAAPVRTALDMLDVDHDGKVDQVVATFSETLAAYTAGTSVWGLTSPPSGATVASVSVAGAVATVTLTEGGSAATTAVGSFKVALTASATGIRDSAGNQASFAAVAPADKAPPALLSLQMLDSDTDGKVDRITADFSEALATPYSAGNAPWTLANIPSAGSLGSVAVSGTTATLTITEGAGAADTAVGSLTVALATNAGGVRDAAGNQSSFAASTPADKAGPVTVTISDTNGATDGKMEAGDTLVVTFSEPLNPTSVPSTTTVSEADPALGGNDIDTLTITGITNGALSTGSIAYVGTNSRTASFANSTVTLSNGNRTVTITVGPTCTGANSACSALGAGNGTLAFLPAATITDLSANAAPIVAAATKSQAIALF